MQDSIDILVNSTLQQSVSQVRLTSRTQDTASTAKAQADPVYRGLDCTLYLACALTFMKTK
jgi:hypothetical protein